MLFGVGGLATLGGALQAIEGAEAWLLIGPAALFALTAALSYWAGYHSLGRYHEDARKIVAKRHSGLLEWSVGASRIFSDGGTIEDVIEKLGDCPGMPTLNDKYLLQAQCLRDQAQALGAVAVLLTLPLVSWLLLEGGVLGPATE